MSANAMSTNNEGWVSWILSWFYGVLYGPTITLEDCLAYFFSADELKGDNMYSCEKCKKESEQSCSKRKKESCSKRVNSLTRENEQSSLTRSQTSSKEINQTVNVQLQSKTVENNSPQNCPEMKSDERSEIAQSFLKNNSQCKKSNPNIECRELDKGKLFLSSFTAAFQVSQLLFKFTAVFKFCSCFFMYHS